VTLHDPLMIARAQPEHGTDRPCLDYAGLFDASPNPYLVLDRALTIVGANRAYLAATKRELADILGRWAWDAFPTDPDTLRQSIASFERVLRTGQSDTVAVLRFDIPRPEAEGGGFEERYWSITHTPVLDGNGEVSLVLQHPIDVTELQRLRDAARYAGEERRVQLAPTQSGILDRARAVQEVNLSLRAEGERLRALFQQAPGFMCMLRGPEHRIELANAAYMQLVGHRDVVGKPVRDALPEAEDQGFIAVLCSNRHLCRIRDEAIAAYPPGHWCSQERVDGRAACYGCAAKQAVGTRGVDEPPGAAAGAASWQPGAPGCDHAAL